jgi:hypothetical protein
MRNCRLFSLLSLSLRSNCERGFLDLSVVSFMLGAAALYYLAGPLSELVDQTSKTQRQNRVSCYNPSSIRNIKSISPLEHFGGSVAPDILQDSLWKKVSNVTSTAGAAYKSSVGMAEDAVGNLTYIKDNAASEWQMLLDGLDDNISDISDGLGLGSSKSFASSLFKGRSAFSGKSGNRRVASRRGMWS